MARKDARLMMEEAERGGLGLAIIPALMITARGARYAIPQTHLLELLRPCGRNAIEHVHGAPVTRLRGALLPLLDLNAALGSNPSEIGVHPIVVLRADDRVFGLDVDAVHDTAEIVVKPLGRHLKGIASFAGATILGDGHVALILDVVGLAQRATPIDGTRATSGTPTAPRGESFERPFTSLLLFEPGHDRRMAIPLGAISRLESLAPDSIETSAGRPVVQFRDGLLPLRWLDEALGGTRPTEPIQQDSLHVAVCSTANGPIGIVVGRIVDVVEVALELRVVAGRPGVAGAAVIQGRVTDVLDPAALLGSDLTQDLAVAP